ncbi:MAG: hypothetical protein OWS74_06085, partial [Firmicutes bacterium]|nr:hypothetical protein [Bacillota bacterium]
LSPKKDATHYQAQRFTVTLYDQEAVAFVYHSEALDKKKEHALQRAIQQEAASLTAALKELQRVPFDCEPDAVASRRARHHRGHDTDPTTRASQNRHGPRDAHRLPRQLGDHAAVGGADSI